MAKVWMETARGVAAQAQGNEKESAFDPKRLTSGKKAGFVGPMLPLPRVFLHEIGRARAHRTGSKCPRL